MPGEDNTVFARVTNLGAEQANGVVVKFWWADPAIAITQASANLMGAARLEGRHALRGMTPLA